MRDKFGTRSGLINLSDFGRPVASWAAKFLKDRSISVLTITTSHLAMGILGAYLIWQENFIAGALLLVFKGVVDAVDGELARQRERPSYVGRYYDSVADFISTIAFFLGLSLALDWPILIGVTLTFVSMMQTTMSNYYGVLIRHSFDGDNHSRVDETTCPTPYPWDHPGHLHLLHKAYVWIYAWQDQVLARIHPKNTSGHHVSAFVYNLSSALGYGFQSLLILFLAMIGEMAWSLYLILCFNMAIGIICWCLVTMERLVDGHTPDLRGGLRNPTISNVDSHSPGEAGSDSHQRA